MQSRGIAADDVSRYWSADDVQLTAGMFPLPPTAAATAAICISLSRFGRRPNREATSTYAWAFHYKYHRTTSSGQ